MKFFSVNKYQTNSFKDYGKIIAKKRDELIINSFKKQKNNQTFTKKLDYSMRK